MEYERRETTAIRWFLSFREPEADTGCSKSSRLKWCNRLRRLDFKVETQPDGTTDVYRAHYDGAVVIEHQDPNGETWFESNEVIGTDGKPVICPDGVPLRIDFDAEVPEPTPSEFAKARRDLPNGKTLVFNEYSGEFQVVDATRVKRDGVSVPAEQFVYQCGPKGEPTLVPLSEVDPRAADDVRRQSADQLQEIDDGLTGLGEDPAKASPPPEP